jgi:hypothetical protein
MIQTYRSCSHTRNYVLITSTYTRVRIAHQLLPLEATASKTSLAHVLDDAEGRTKATSIPQTRALSSFRSETGTTTLKYVHSCLGIASRPSADYEFCIQLCWVGVHGSAQGRPRTVGPIRSFRKVGYVLPLWILAVCSCRGMPSGDLAPRKAVILLRVVGILGELG